MSNLNPGEEAVTNSLSELLHELPSAEGKIGTDFYSLKTESGLQNMLESLKDASWEDEMNATPIDSALQARLNAQRTGDLQFKSVELQEILPKNTDLSAAEQMRGTGVTPLDVEVYSRSKANTPEAVEMVEMRVLLDTIDILF